MRYLHFPIYCRGGAGFSNVVMSWELGVVASFLLDRVLVVEGNVSPPANIVAYHDKGVTNRYMARVPDLFEIPVPWIEAEQARYDADSAFTMCPVENVADAVFVWPPQRERDTDDFRSFARGREGLIVETPESRDAPVVRLTATSENGHAMENLGFYSYFYYLDAPTRRVVDALLRRMKPLPPYAELAKTVSQSLGDFNAVHIRRGDFKQTYGTTALVRKPTEVLERLDRSFQRDQTLLILTDERDDPFFEEITACYKQSVFIDHHILDHYRDGFFDLPLHDSIALAFLSQLVAADSLDFVGTMTSTFTSLVQRFRANRGLPESFKFLWNELPEPGSEIERGSHTPSDFVPLNPDGTLVDQQSGPYTWNRVNEYINPAWQREWPESFLAPEMDGETESALFADFEAKRREGEPAAEVEPEAPNDVQTRRGPPRVHRVPRVPHATTGLRDFDPLPFVQVTNFLAPSEYERLLEATLAGALQLDPVLVEAMARRLRLLIPNVLPCFDLSREIRASDFELSARSRGDSGSLDPTFAANPDEITCCYFFRREPRSHSGGALRLRQGENVHLVDPRNNAVMLYPTSALTGVTEIHAPSAGLEDSRFSIRVRIA